MSRFFRGGDDSSSESSSDEEELYSGSEEEEEEDKIQNGKDEDSEEDSDEEEEESDSGSSDSDAGPQKKGLSRFLVEASSESEESDVEGTTKVKSAKDKRFDELEATITAIQNGQKINDWGVISNGS